jgi:hypothetical protein
MINIINSKIFYLFFIFSFFSNSNIAQANLRNTIINKSNCTTRTAKYRSELEKNFSGHNIYRKGHWYYCISSNNSKYEVLRFFADRDKSINMHNVEKIGYLNKDNVEWDRYYYYEDTQVYSEEGFPFFGRLINYGCSVNHLQKTKHCWTRVLGKRINVIP